MTISIKVTILQLVTTTTRGKLMNEIFPKGFNSWTAYYRHNEKVAKVKYWVNGILGMIVLFGAIALDGYINVTMGM